MSGSRFLKSQFAFLTALILLAVCKTAPGVSAEQPQPATTTVAAAESASTPEAPKDDRRIVINIPSRTLWVYSGDQIVRYFPVGVGRVGFMTPMGKFSIIRKVVDPGWENPYLPTGKVRLAPGEENPLGTRWMGFYQKDGGEYGLHGTDTPTSVGKFSSHGCVRMKVPDAEALFDMVDVGTPVDVIYQPVLIRKQGSHVRVIVYADRFRRGMPSVDRVKADILKQYPGVRLDLNKLKAALQMPNERPTDVGALPLAESATVNLAEQKTEAPSHPVEPKTAEPQKSPLREPDSNLSLPVSPRTLFNSETTRL